MQGGRGWRAFGERKIIPQSFRRARICKFSRQKTSFLQLRKYWLFLATLVALHFTPVSKSVSEWAEFQTSVASRLASLLA